MGKPTGLIAGPLHAIRSALRPIPRLAKLPDQFTPPLAVGSFSLVTGQQFLAAISAQHGDGEHGIHRASAPWTTYCLEHDGFVLFLVRGLELVRRGLSLAGRFDQFLQVVGLAFDELHGGVISWVQISVEDSPRVGTDRIQGGGARTSKCTELLVVAVSHQGKRACAPAGQSFVPAGNTGRKNQWRQFIDGSRGIFLRALIAC